LQAVNAVLALLTITVAAGSLIFGAASPVYEPAILPVPAALDSNLRFLGGVGVGLGTILLLITPRIERHTSVFRAVWSCAMLGGIGRLVSAGIAGVPSPAFLIFAIIEVLGVPVLLYWQSQLAKADPWNG
jgi:hypothetical protein